MLGGWLWATLYGIGTSHFLSKWVHPVKLEVLVSEVWMVVVLVGMVLLVAAAWVKI
jgi:hypothetical protein